MVDHSRARGIGVVAAAVLAVLLGFQPAHAGQDEDALDLERLAGLSLEELMQIDVTSVAGVEQAWFKTPAAIYVITNEDVRRTGHLHLAEALRLSPGVFVGRRGASSWSVGARGFNGGLSNKLLVLIDGREVYDPLQSGTFWDIQDVLFEDLDRIEVIRGPGPTLWGANAVNGVINVTTRPADQTQGWLVKGGFGTQHRAHGAVRYGGQINDDTHFRVWGKYFDIDDLEAGDGSSAHDDWDMARGGFRFDGAGDEGFFWTAEGDIYDAQMGEIASLPILGGTEQVIGDGRATGGHFLARFGRETDDGGWRVQAYYDHVTRVAAGGFEFDRDMGEIDFRHHFRLGDRHQLIYGMQYRHWTEATEANRVVSLDPATRETDMVGAFIQDTFTVVPDTLFLMAGTKFEYNDFSGFEVQPSVRLSYTPDDRQTFWAAFSRPVRTPSRLEEEGTLTLGILPGDVPFQVVGSDLDSEKLRAYEAGYRVRLTDDLTLDLAAFYNDYDNLIFVGPLTPPIVPFVNAGTAETYGAELAVEWRPADNWRLHASYSVLDVLVHGPVLNNAERETPHHMAQLRSYLDLTPDIELNTALYYVDQFDSNEVDDYLRLDIGVTWHVNDQLDLSVWGQDLLQPSHREFQPVENQRAAYFMATFRF